MARESGMELLVYTNPEAVEKDINPFEHVSVLHIDIAKTEGLKQALNYYKFDVIFGGTRRDEEKSCAKERVFSFRTVIKISAPNFGTCTTPAKPRGKHSRFSSLELDGYLVIHLPGEYSGLTALLCPMPAGCGVLRHDYVGRRPLPPATQRANPARTLGCYPLTGAIDSEAETLKDILLELIHARQSERQGRKIDTDSAGSMEKKKQEGYF